MKNKIKSILSRKSTLITLLAITVLFIGIFVYTVARPISYGLAYTSTNYYDGIRFDRSDVYHVGNQMTLTNSNEEYSSGMDFYYYYSNGWVFNCVATNDEEYAAEVEAINADFDNKVNELFYAFKINAFTCSYSNPLEPESSITNVCGGAIAFAIAFGVMSLVSIALSAFSFLLYKKSKTEA